MEFGEAALRILREEGRHLHWTVIQDLALRRGYIDPFGQSDLRRSFLRALADLEREGTVTRVDKGVYAIPD